MLPLGWGFGAAAPSSSRMVESGGGRGGVERMERTPAGLVNFYVGVASVLLILAFFCGFAVGRGL